MELGEAVTLTGGIAVFMFTFGWLCKNLNETSTDDKKSSQDRVVAVQTVEIDRQEGKEVKQQIAEQKVASEPMTPEQVAEKERLAAEEAEKQRVAAEQAAEKQRQATARREAYEAERQRVAAEQATERQSQHERWVFEKQRLGGTPWTLIDKHELSFGNGGTFGFLQFDTDGNTNTTEELLKVPFYDFYTMAKFWDAKVGESRTYAGWIKFLRHPNSRTSPEIPRLSVSR